MARQIRLNSNNFCSMVMNALCIIINVVQDSQMDRVYLKHYGHYVHYTLQQP